MAGARSAQHQNRLGISAETKAIDGRRGKRERDTSAASQCQGTLTGTNRCVQKGEEALKITK